MKNENNKLIPMRTVSGWKICMDNCKLNAATKKTTSPYLSLTKCWIGLQERNFTAFWMDILDITRLLLHLKISTIECLLVPMAHLYFATCLLAYTTR